MHIKQQQKNWWTDIDGLTYETWEACANGTSNNLKVTDLRFFALLPDFQTINTLQLYTEQKQQQQQQQKEQQQKIT